MTGCRFSRRRATRGEEDPPRRVRAGVCSEAGLRWGEGTIVKEAAFPCLLPCLPQHGNLLCTRRQFPAGRAACPVRGFPRVRPSSNGRERPPPHPYRCRFRLVLPGREACFRRRHPSSCHKGRGSSASEAPDQKKSRVYRGVRSRSCPAGTEHGSVPVHMDRTAAEPFGGRRRFRRNCS